MEDLFKREQQVYTEALAHMQETENGIPCDAEKFKRLAREYGQLLKQFRKITKISDKSARKLILHEIQLRSQTVRDALTGLYNRRFLDDGLDACLKELSETKEMISVLMIDVDHFKGYNDAYGHGNGDECLKSIADVLEGSLRTGDGFAARYGGEEFTVVLPRTNQSGAQIVANRLLERVQKLAISHGKSSVADVVTISIGFTSGVADGKRSAAEYTRRADEALYLSKRNGRNRCTYLTLEEEEK